MAAMLRAWGPVGLHPILYPCPNPVTAQVAEVRGVLAALGAEYATRLRTFVALLPTQAPVDLNFLLFRLEAGKGDAAAA
jgi:hypothetical protein